MVGAALVLFVHLCWILFVIFGAIWTRHRPFLTAVHIASLLWGVVVEVSPLPCPLTWIEQRVNPYRGGFLFHYLDRIVYPDVPGWLLTSLGVTVCTLNLTIYAQRYARTRRH